MANKDNPRKGSHIELDKEELINLIKDLNAIPSPTDKEEDLIKYISNMSKWCKDYKLRTRPCGSGNCANVAPLYIGHPDAKYVFVTHCDRREENKELTGPDNEEIVI